MCQLCADSSTAVRFGVRCGYGRLVPRRSRATLGEEGIFHVTARGTGGCFIFVEDLDRLDFVDLFWDSALQFEWECFVVLEMGTHYHAVFRSAREQLSEGMRKLNGSYARRFNLRHERRGHLFEGRFNSWVIDDERRLLNTIAYVLYNPVRASLRRLPNEWEWSWLEPSWAALLGPPLARPATSDCPMGQSLVRALERQRKARVLGTGAPRLNGQRLEVAARGSQHAVGQEQDDL